MTRKKRILVVDDSAPIRGLVSIILKGEGHEVIEAEDGSEALLKLNGTEGVDLIITDLKMPGMDGFELIRRLKTEADHRNIPVVVMTGEFMSEQGMVPGVHDVIMKPFIPRKLLDSIERFLVSGVTGNQNAEEFYDTNKAV